MNKENQYPQKGQPKVVNDQQIEENLAKNHERRKNQVAPEDIEPRTDGDFAEEQVPFGNQPQTNGTAANDFNDQLGENDLDDDLTNDHVG